MDKDDKSPKQEKITKNDEEPNKQNHSKSEKQPNKKIKIDLKNKKVILSVFGVIILIVVIVIVLNHKSYEEYDLKGLTIKEACERARGAGWEVSGVVSQEGDDKTDCYNTTLKVTNYKYNDFSSIGEGHEVTIYFGEKKTEEEKQAECEATGKWYRNRQCKSQEEWENDYAWENAHAACKKYGSSGYAKTLTDCYVGGEYKGPVDGAPATESQSSSQTEPQSSSSNASSTDTSSNTSWRQVLSEYEAWFNKYIDFMVKYKNTTDTTAKLPMLEDYSKLVSEMTEWTQKLDSVKGDLSASDLNEYIQTINRINQRLSELN